jgi:hypothetical protein
MSSHIPPPPHANSFVLGPAVTNTHTLYVQTDGCQGYVDQHDQYELNNNKLARTLYMQWLRKANTIVQLLSREGSPRKK